MVRSELKCRCHSRQCARRQGVKNVGADDQDIVQHASDETEVTTIPLPQKMPASLGKKMNDGRKNGDLWWLRPES